MLITNYQGNENQTIVRYHFIPVRIAVVKNQKITRAGEDVDESEHLLFADGNVTGYSHYGEQYASSSKSQMQNQHIIQQSLYRICTQKNRKQGLEQRLCTSVHNSIILQYLKGGDNPNVHRWVNKQNMAYKYSGVLLLFKNK